MAEAIELALFALSFMKKEARQLGAESVALRLEEASKKLQEIK